MRRTIIIVCFFSASILWAQSAPPSKVNRIAIEQAKNCSISKLDPDLPNVSLEFFLKYESQGAPIRWQVNDCGGRSGNRLIDRERDKPMCVEADVDLKNGVLMVWILVGLQGGLIDPPEFVAAEVTGETGASRTIRRLSDVPMELHRRVPSKMPADRPPIVG